VARPASAVKVFPASVSCPEFFSAVRAPLPDMPLVATGGVDLVGAASFLRHGCAAVGVGGPLLGTALDGGGPSGRAEQVRERAVAFVQVCRRGSRDLADRGFELVTLGEVMVSLSANGSARCAARAAGRLGGRVGANVASASSGSGTRELAEPAGADEFGSWSGALARAGVTLRGGGSVRPTGLMVKERSYRGRRPSAVLPVRLGGLPARPGGPALWPLVESARVLHVTGITPALSGSAADAVRRAVSVGSRRRVTVSLDVNYRARLWTRRAARVSSVPWHGWPTGVRQRRRARRGGRRRRHRSGCSPTGCTPSWSPTARRARTRSPPPAWSASRRSRCGWSTRWAPGDAFVAGYLAGLLDDLDEPAGCARRPPPRRSAWGAGRLEGLPTTAELTLVSSAGRHRSPLIPCSGLVSGDGRYSDHRHSRPLSCGNVAGGGGGEVDQHVVGAAPAGASTFGVRAQPQ